MTSTEFPIPQPLKRCAIIGTAPSWQQCPFGDKSLEIWTLNDGYLLGIPRSDRHYEIHPFHQMNFRPRGQRVVSQAEVPVGAYVRPSDHLDYLRSRSQPVYLAEARPDFPTSLTFPKQAILDAFASFWPWRLTRRGQLVAGEDYEVSTPVWMLMHAIVEGYQEIHIYGIHLATEWEYMQQRPNFEFVMGVAAGRGIKVVLPDASPLCKGGFQYAYELKADIPIQSVQLEIQAIKYEGAQVQQARAKLGRFEIARRKDLEARLRTLDVDLADAKQRLMRHQMQQRVA